MAPPPDSAAGCDRPAGAGRSTALRAVLAPHQPGPGRQIVIRTGKPSADSRAKPGTQARPIVLLHQPQGDGLSPINPSPPLPAIGTGRLLSTYSLASMRGVSTASSPCTRGAELPVLLGWAPGGFTGRVGEEHRSARARDLVFVRRSGRRCPAPAQKGLPAETGSRRNSMPALIHPGWDQARRAAASRCTKTCPLAIAHR
jgi:hypothetical protein